VVSGEGTCRVGGCGLVARRGWFRRRRRRRSLSRRWFGSGTEEPVQVYFADGSRSECGEKTLAHVDAIRTACRAFIHHGCMGSLALVLDGDRFTTSATSGEVGRVHSDNHVVRMVEPATGNFSSGVVIVGTWSS